MAPDAFVSVVAARHLDRPGQPVDDARLVVRARLREHLAVLLDRHADLLAGCVITESATTDYPVRFVVAKATFSEVMRREVLAINHSNFKAEAGRRSKGSAYPNFLHDVWSLGLSLQRPVQPRREPPRRQHDDHDQRRWWEAPKEDEPPF